jgi:hypothetical protein
MDELEFSSSSYASTKSGTKIDDCYWLFVNDGRDLIKVDLESFQYQLFSGLIEPSALRHSHHFGDSIFVLGNAGKIWEFNRSRMECFEYMDLMSDDYFRIVALENHIFLFPACESGSILIIDRKTRTKKIYKDYPEDFLVLKKDWTMYTGFCETYDKVYFSRRSTNYIPVLDKKKEVITWVYLNMLSEKEIKKMCMKRQMVRGSSSSIIEKEDGGLIDFINALQI